jgi:hypothetical protein
MTLFSLKTTYFPNLALQDGTFIIDPEAKRWKRKKPLSKPPLATTAEWAMTIKQNSSFFREVKPLRRAGSLFFGQRAIFPICQVS